MWDDFQCKAHNNKFSSAYEPPTFLCESFDRYFVSLNNQYVSNYKQNMHLYKYIYEHNT